VPWGVFREGVPRFEGVVLVLAVVGLDGAGG
jgi:hypothetical protein